MSQAFDSYSFFDGTGMTPVTQVTWADYWRGVIPDGVIAGIGNECKPYGNSTGMVIYIDTGAVMADNHRGVVSTPKSLQIAAADANYDRIDTVVARVVYGNENESYMELDVLTGTAEADPVAPEITQSTGGTYEVKLAEVTVRAGVVTITVDDVNDTRSVYTNGEASPSWKNTDDEIMVKGDVVMMDKGEEGGILKCTANNPPLGVVTSLNIGPGQYGKIETIAGKIAEVRCNEEAVAIGDALIASEVKGLAIAGGGYAAGVALAPKASGIIGNVRSLLTVFTQLTIQNKWWIVDGILDENVIAAYRFSGVGSMSDALRDQAHPDDDTYILSPWDNNVSWGTDTGFTIPATNNQKTGLNSNNLNNQASTIKAAAVRYEGFGGNSSKRCGLICITPSDRSLYANSWGRSTNQGVYGGSCHGIAVGNYVAEDVPLKGAAVIGANFDAKNPMYLDGVQLVTSAYSRSGVDFGFTNPTTIGQGGFGANWNMLSGSTYRILSAVFYNVALNDDSQWVALTRNMQSI